MHFHDVVAYWSELGQTPAGDFTAASFSPHDPNRIYLGSDKNGLFRSSSEIPEFSIIDTFSGPSPHILQPVVELPDVQDFIIVNCLHNLWVNLEGEVLLILLNHLQKEKGV